MQRPVDAVIEFLNTELSRGKTHVLIDESARDSLRDLYIRSHPKYRSAKPPSQAEQTPTPPTSQTIQVPTGPREEQWQAIQRQAASWQAARSLDSLRPTMVFGAGSLTASLMLVGEAPGYEEERQKTPFVGPAGQKLNDILRAMGIDRDSIYVTNVVKFRPATPNQTTNNRPPTQEEIEACLPILLAEIQLIQPTCIVALGGSAACGLLGIKQSVAQLRNAWHPFLNIPVRVTYHPSYLLRQTENTTKRQVWEDMLAVMELLKLPISTKQRNYFLPKNANQ